LHLLRREPRQFGLQRARWRLGDLLAQLYGWQLQGLSSRSRRLHRRHSSFQSCQSFHQGRRHVHAPACTYQPKQQVVASRELAAHVAAQVAGWDSWPPPAVLHPPRRQVAVLLDELTDERQPSLARALAGGGWDTGGQPNPPLAELSRQRTNETRVVASLDVVSGQVCWRQRSRVGVRERVGRSQEVRAAYPAVERIWGIQDTWPVHWHADLLVALEPQESRLPAQAPAQLVSPAQCAGSQGVAPPAAADPPGLPAALCVLAQSD
jgi:hypothetical protein